jgi:hypothetical protein
VDDELQVLYEQENAEFRRLLSALLHRARNGRNYITRELQAEIEAALAGVREPVVLPIGDDEGTP